MIRFLFITFFGVFIFLFFTNSLLNAQQFNIKNYNINEGIAQPYVYTIAQGKLGRLWVGTGDGLSSFDGVKFQNYSTKDGLAENFVTSSFRDIDGNIWFGHYEGGLTIYDNNKFKVFSKSIAQSPISSICQDDYKNIWIGTKSDGIVKINPSSKIDHYKDLISNTSINKIHAYQHYLIVATTDGLKILENKTLKPTIQKSLLDYISITNIAPLSTDKFLIATQDEGIFQLNISKDSIYTEEIYSESSIKGLDINILFPDFDNIFWIGTYGQGISKFKYTPDQKLIKIAQYNTSNGLTNNYIKSFFIDKDGDVIMGTFGNGIEVLIDPIFTLYGKKEGLLSANANAVTSYGNALFIANDNSVVKFILKKYKLNDLSEKSQYINVVGGAKITSIISIEEDVLFIGTDNNGIWKLNLANGASERWFYSPTNTLANKINHLNKDKKNQLWVATEDGVFLFNSSSSKPINHLTMESGLLHNNIFSVFIDSRNTAWFATHGSGISNYNNKINTFPSPNESSGLEINAFTEDRKGNIWIGTYGQGIYKFDGKKVVKKYNQSNGLGSNYCYLINCDKNNNLWVGHKNGLTKCDINNENFVFYQKKDDFLVDEIINNASTEDFDGNLWFGSSEGLLRYNLNVDKPKKTGPSVIITSIELYFQKVDWKKYSNQLYTLAQIPLNLELPYDKNHFTFHVRGISFSEPDKIKYKYKLEGFQKDWSLETKEDFVTYPNIPPGKYIFKVVAANKEGIWQEVPMQFEFIILNPFWKTWWFYLITFLFVLLLFVLILKFRTRALEREQKILQEEKIKLLAEITDRKRAERKLKESEDRLKETNKELNTFIYRASHDLKGPLSTVKGLTNLGQMEIKDEASLKYFGLISDRINRLDFILKDLINIVEITEVVLQIEAINFNEILAEIKEEIHKIELPKALRLRFNIEYKNLFMGDKRALYSVLLNLLDNAVRYYNNDKTDILVIVDIADYKNGVLIMISDNGIGIPTEIKSRVFDMFFRGTDQSKGSGLGLYLVKKIVNRLGGKIKLTSLPKQGTQIELFIPSYNESIEDAHEKINYPITSME
ncbi:MAG: hypothetical protein EAZ07_03450 [Cytophagales bacterium]|nr:MAG: hypothetical protein EAZ07_03450 [Cytophagales bacterium]